MGLNWTARLKDIKKTSFIDNMHLHEDMIYGKVASARFGLETKHLLIPCKISKY